ncbi:hypothetical protein BRC61_05640 [Halobacteriales archaeon QH_10_65_19]|nr:MAG: hypothetical protein BRC61_05640 [Halobacteriales archaeon QH_10_65_19]
MTVLDGSDPTDPTEVAMLETSEQFASAGATNSVAVSDRVLAVAVAAQPDQEPGRILFYDTDTLAFLASVTVGALPDYVTFSPDGSYLLSADEGEPSDDYSVDPEDDIEEGDQPADAAGDLGPEGLTFVSAADSPIDDALLIVGFETSGTTGVFRIKDAPPAIVGDSVPRDLDGDGFYEDIDGDGEFTIGDVQVFFQNYQSDVVQNNAEFFNFSESEPSEVSIGDVQALFQQVVD